MQKVIRRRSAFDVSKLKYWRDAYLRYSQVSSVAGPCLAACFARAGPCHGDVMELQMLPSACSSGATVILKHVNVIVLTDTVNLTC